LIAENLAPQNLAVRVVDETQHGIFAAKKKNDEEQLPKINVGPPWNGVMENHGRWTETRCVKK
jgi:hypothetical protein